MILNLMLPVTGPQSKKPGQIIPYEIEEDEMKHHPQIGLDWLKDLIPDTGTDAFTSASLLVAHEHQLSETTLGVLA
jgi:hypothetical protein